MSTDPTPDAGTAPDGASEAPAEPPAAEPGPDPLDSAAELVLKATDAPVAPTCPNCAEALVPDQRFCEACGEDLKPEADGIRCIDCSAPAREIDKDGYCSQCGRKQPDGRDHLEIDHGLTAGVTDKGLSHHRNEDAFAAASLPNGGITVVCDGVSSTGEPQKASQAAADTTLNWLMQEIRNGNPDMGAAIVDAVAEGQLAVIRASEMIAGKEPPSCTLVATTVLADPTTGEITVTVGWLGDSRGYWVTPDPEAGTFEVTQLTEDDSWAQVQISLGTMTEEAAMREPQAHSITKWLGADSVDSVPRVATHTGQPGGFALACSDGLWNYANSGEEMAQQIQKFYGQGSLHLAQELVKFANESGGHDNITVAVIQL